MLTELIIEICECERRTEYVRKLLSELQDFEPYTGIEQNYYKLLRELINHVAVRSHIKMS